ncbi:hypothetical protein SORDD05_00833 [Streptococcus oralis]|uniref:Uncharacterized protein n=1 Tax=Streptococcus oralis TaxID=1303 RepID=A0A139M9U7_STROR|nr:hypothetical protein SORDD05_00833 [Streptococcus oralis]
MISLLFSKLCTSLSKEGTGFKKIDWKFTGLPYCLLIEGFDKKYIPSMGLISCLSH